MMVGVAVLVTAFSRSMFTLKVWGVTLFLVAASVGAEIIVRYQVAWTADRAVSIVAALEEYRTEEGTYPEELEALVPEYLTQIPHTRTIRILGGFQSFMYEKRPDREQDYCLSYLYIIGMECHWCNKISGNVQDERNWFCTD